MLAGEQVGLRAIERADLPHLLAWRNRPDFRRYFRESRELGMEDQERWFDEYVVRDPNTIMFSIVELGSDRLLGAAGLCYVNWISKNADISLYIGADDLYIDEVFAVDTARTLLRYGFGELGLHRVWAEIYEYDEPKRSLFEGLGFKLDGRFREHHFAEGSWHDSLFYGILSEEFSSPL